LDKSILITGASKGIGRAAAQALADTGWHVIGVARSIAGGFPGEFVSCDLTDSDAIRKLARDVVSRGNVLGVVNNFGIARHERFESVTDVDFMALLGANLRPALQVTQALLLGMRDAKFGRIVNIGSLTTRGLPYRAGYAAAKSALESLTRTIAIEYAAYGITANIVAPGPTETELFRANNQPGSEGEARYLAGVPAGRFGRPEEIAAAISFFCSDLASFITGQSLFIDGGSSLGKG